MAESGSGAGALKRIGGRLCLDFANTVDWRAGERPEERLTSYGALAAWGERAGILAGGEAESLLREARRHPAEADAVLRRAIVLREAIHGLFLALAEGRTSADADLAELNAALAEALPQLRLVQDSGTFAWAWSAGQGALARMLWPVARSAAELLTSEAASRVRVCADEACGWLFLDTSRNRSRRWCAMEDCGNRAKARRHYRRKRGAPATRAPEDAPAAAG